MKILGVDPGTRHLGYCLVETHNGTDHGTVVLKGTLGLKGKKIDWPTGIIQLARRLVGEVWATGKLPDVVAIEQINWYGRRKGVLSLAHLAGALGGAWSHTVADILYFSPQEVKLTSATVKHPKDLNEHETDAFSLCWLAAKKAKLRVKNNQSVVAHKTQAPKRV